METELNTNEILDLFNAELGQGNEPNRELLRLDNIGGRSMITPTQRILLTQLSFIAKEFELAIIDELIIHPFLVYGLSVNGLARDQFKQTLQNPIDYYKGMLGGGKDFEPMPQGNRKL